MTAYYNISSTTLYINFILRLKQRLLTVLPLPATILSCNQNDYRVYNGQNILDEKNVVKMFMLTMKL